MSNFDLSQVQSLRASLLSIQTLNHPMKQNQLCMLIQKAQTILGIDSPHIAIFYYEYAAFILSKIESTIDLFNPDKAHKTQQNGFFADNGEFSQTDSDDDYNGANNHIIQREFTPHELEKNQKTSHEDTKITSKPSNQQNLQPNKRQDLNQNHSIQNIQNDNKHQEKLQQIQNVKLNDQDQSQEESEDLSDIEVCYENFKAALNIYDRELKKMQNGEESPLDPKETSKYKFHIHGRLGELYAMDQKYEESIGEFRTVVKLASDFDHPETLRIISEAHFSIGNALLHQNNSGCEELAIQEYISAVKYLIKYMKEVEGYNTGMFEVPSVDKPRVDRYQYLRAPKDNQSIAELKQVISMILNKIEVTYDKINVDASHLQVDLKIDKEKMQLGLREGSNLVHVENADNIGKRKRVPSETNISADHISKTLVGLNPDLPSQELRNLRLLDEVEPNVNDEIDDLLESTVKPVFSPCGKYYASFNSGSVEIRDASSNLTSPIVRIELREKAYKGFTATPINTNIKFSPDSCFFAVLKVNTLLIYSIQGKLKMRISDYFVEDNIKKSVMEKPFRRDIRDFFWSQNQAQPQIIVQFKQANIFKVYTIDSENVFQINFVIDGMQKNYAFGRGSNSNLMAVACKAHQKKQKCMEICLFSTSDIQWKFVSFHMIPTVYIDKVELTQKNQFLLFSPPSRLLVHIYNFLSKQFKILIQDPFLLLSDYKISDSGKYLALATNSGNIFVYDTYSWVKIFEFQMDSKVNLENNLIVHNEQDDGFRVETKGIFKLPYISQTEKTFDPGFPPLLNSITKIQFSPNNQFIAVKSIEMPHCVFIYGLRNVLTIIIRARNKVRDFKWLKVNGAGQTLCIALKKNGVALWKNTCLAGSVVQQFIPDNPSGEIKVTDIEVSKQGSLILYAKEQKKFTYCLFDPSSQLQQKQEIQI